MKMFDRVLNVVLVAAVLYGVFVISRRPGAPSPRPSYAVGEVVPAIAGVGYADAKLTTVLFVRSSCHFCTESMGFYRELEEGGARLVAISMEPPDQLTTYLSENGLAIESATVGQEWTKLTGTPTMIVVDASGKIVGTWVGLLSDKNQQQVRELLKGRV